MQGKKINKFASFVEGSYIKVVVTHIESPSSFYINRQDARTIQVSKKIKLFEKLARSAPHVEVQDIAENVLYLVQCSDNHWYRGRVLMITNERIVTSTVKVFLVDIGRCEDVPVSKIFYLKPVDDFQNVHDDEELAFECCLHECFPVGLRWKDETIQNFKDILANYKQNFSMLIKKAGPMKLQVDLQWQDKGNCTSMREYFIFSKVATMVSSKLNNVSFVTPKDLKYFVDRDFRISEWVNVKVMHIDNPNCFYVKRDDNTAKDKLEGLFEEINSFYRNKQNYINHAIQKPYSGMAVAAQYNLDNKWYRARIIQINFDEENPHRTRVRVSYVDFGNTEWLSICRVRWLEEEFAKLTVQVVHCTLHDVKPVKDKYSKVASNIFANQVKNKILKMVIESIANGVLSVQLYRKHDDKPDEICINVKLIEKGLARGVGKLSKVVCQKTVDSDEETEETQKRRKKRIHSIDTSSKKLESSINSADTSNKKVGSSEVEDTSNKKVDSSEVEDEENTVTQPVEKKVNDMGIRVKILSCINPNKMFISIVDFEPTFANLMNDMLKFYNNETNNVGSIPDNINIGTKYAVYVSNDDKWYRCVVRAQTEDEQYLVSLKDCAKDVTVPVNNIRTLADEFMKMTDGATPCHLAGIEWKSDWDEDICESLRAVLNGFQEIRMKKKGDIENNSMPIELLGRNVIVLDALEPSSLQEVNINELLKKDSTLHVKNKQLDSDIEELEQAPEDILKKLDTIANSQDHVKEWLKNNIAEATVHGIEYSEILGKDGEIPTSALFLPDKCGLDHSMDELSLLSGLSNVDSELQDWMPPDPLPLKTFVGFPTNVDMEFNIYVQLNDRQNGCMDMIENGLMSRYKNSRPLPTDMNWRPGQICISEYYLDKKWYRGRVKQVNRGEKKALIEYVDYGNEEWVEYDFLRKNISLQHIPVQCYKLPLRSDCVPTTEDRKWTIPVLDYAHVTIVEKICEITLKQEDSEDFPRIEKLVLLPQKMDLFELLVSLGHATLITKIKKPIKLVKTPGTNKKKKTSVSEKLKCSSTSSNRNDNSSSGSSVPVIEKISTKSFSWQKKTSKKVSSSGSSVSEIENLSKT